MTTTVFSVPGVSCEHCKHAITTELLKLPDVEAADVDVAAKRVTVTGTASDADMRSAIDEAGYDVAG